MKLSDLLNGLVAMSSKNISLAAKIDVNGLALDSRNVRTNDVFIALAGDQQHGLTFVGNAIANGAAAVLFDPTNGGDRLAQAINELPAIAIENLGKIIGIIAARFYEEPSNRLDVIGITGTNGKTSCSQFLGQLLDDCGIIGTLGWGEWDRLHTTINTTPDALSLQQIMAEFVRQNKKAVAMEVSSHGLDQGRVNGITFKGAVYTNISRDHLDYHGTMEEYLAAKLKLLQSPGLEFAIINMDDDYCQRILAAASAQVRCWGVTAKDKQAATDEFVSARNIKHQFDGIEMQINWRDELQTIKVPLYGDFNTENILCVLAVMLALGYSLTDIASKLSAVKPVAGRMDRCETDTDKVSVFVDYAHSPDALNRVLGSLRQHCVNQLWVVFGCGGNRDTGKRPQMGSIAEQWADHVIVTDDNPRFENNETIAKEILSGCHSDKVILIQDRKEAIQYAINHAVEHDCILIAGKGHENYQEIKGVQYPFNDKQIAEETLTKRFGCQ
ncbi:MAG: UDP-N-acetylmuramoyl-L-alanyl-D-glutamate--2,6-diaminopimelate ligase [Gammaproteobacteria bacterium]|nr:UDP-N-acetylmuramoyl-L-alanyl-D-glutamate--2,6-diaminopimelate ligase [Gammaproteobacteria bacterium]